ncbi:MAG TPA: cation transporter dimerization domain-containing protein, partial [Usitatibacter sp.]|nr:cation transporter dimerization domain-containing protein [Usitatibacter sp.]
RIPGHDAPSEVQNTVATTLRRLAQGIGAIRDVHSVRARETPQGLVVNFHCRADPGLSVEAVHHAVDELERRLLTERKDICRAIGHSEPDRRINPSREPAPAR